MTTNKNKTIIKPFPCVYDYDVNVLEAMVKLNKETLDYFNTLITLDMPDHSLIKQFNEAFVTLQLDLFYSTTEYQRVTEECSTALLRNPAVSIKILKILASFPDELRTSVKIAVLYGDYLCFTSENSLKYHNSLKEIGINIEKITIDDVDEYTLQFPHKNH